MAAAERSHDCIAVIPARYESVRFPGKPLASLAGKPLIRHVVERCQAVSEVREVVVATDDARIAEAVADLARVEMTSPELASGTDRVAAVAATETCELVLNVQGDEPLIDPDELGDAVRRFAVDSAEFATLRAPLASFADLADPNVVKLVVDDTGRALYFSRAPIPFPREQWRRSERGLLDDLGAETEPPPPGLCWQHVGVYLYRRQALARWARIPPSSLERVEGLEQLRILEAGETIQTYAVAEALPGVDTPEDLERVRERLGSEAAC